MDIDIVCREDAGCFAKTPGLVDYFLFSNSIFHHMAPVRGYFYAIIRHTELFQSTYLKSR